METRRLSEGKDRLTLGDFRCIYAANISQDKECWIILCKGNRPLLPTVDSNMNMRDEEQENLHGLRIIC